ncbi:zf-TFIIB domain-containing protein [Chloroflexota bacterium]
MICPTCRNIMIVVEHEQIELDYCTVCSGVWFDSGELELMLERILSLPVAATTEKKRKCPICRRKMKKVLVGEAPEILIDACPAGDGLWFDGGEVIQLIPQCAGKPCGDSDDQGRMLTFLGETFKIGDSPAS